MYKLKKEKKIVPLSPTTRRKALKSSKVKLGTFQIRNDSLDMQQNIQEVTLFFFFFLFLFKQTEFDLIYLLGTIAIPFKKILEKYRN